MKVDRFEQKDENVVDCRRSVLEESLEAKVLDVWHLLYCRQIPIRNSVYCLRCPV